MQPTVAAVLVPHADGHVERELRFYLPADGQLDGVDGHWPGP